MAVRFHSPFPAVSFYWCWLLQKEDLVWGVLFLLSFDFLGGLGGWGNHCLIWHLHQCSMGQKCQAWGGGVSVHQSNQLNESKKTLESPLDSKEIKPVNPKRNQPWIFTGRTDAKAEAPILCPPDVKSWLMGKDPDAGKDWGQEKGATEDEVVGWHHWLNEHEFEQTAYENIKTRKPGVLFMGSQRTEHNLATEEQWRIILTQLLIFSPLGDVIRLYLNL